jgi:hypothetical protein
MKKLSNDQMRKLEGGRKVLYTCNCSGGTGSWAYTSGNQPSESTVSNDIHTYCSSGAGTCLWHVYA